MIKLKTNEKIVVNWQIIVKIKRFSNVMILKMEYDWKYMKNQENILFYFSFLKAAAVVRITDPCSSKM